MNQTTKKKLLYTYFYTLLIFYNCQANESFHQKNQQIQLPDQQAMAYEQEMTPPDIVDSPIMLNDLTIIKHDENFIKNRPAIKKTDAIKAQEKNSSSKKKPITAADLIHIQETVFVNSRVNNIVLKIIDKKNKEYLFSIHMGTEFTIHHEPESLKQAICLEPGVPETITSQADLKTYSVFVYNTDQKTEKYNFITIQQKINFLQMVRKLKEDELFQEIDNLTIYKL